MKDNRFLLMFVIRAGELTLEILDANFLPTVKGAFPTNESLAQ